MFPRRHYHAAMHIPIHSISFDRSECIDAKNLIHVDRITEIGRLLVAIVRVSFSWIDRAFYGVVNYAKASVSLGPGPARIRFDGWPADWKGRKREGH